MSLVSTNGNAARPTADVGYVGCALILGLLVFGACGGTPASPTSLDSPVVGSPGDAWDAAAGTGAVVVTAPGQAWRHDHYVLNSAAVAGDALTLDLSFGGGCGTHDFTLVVSASFLESSPVQLPVSLAHDANGDPCEAWLTEQYVFDLTLVKERYRDAYGPGAGAVVLLFDGFPGGRLTYEFTA